MYWFIYCDNKGFWNHTTETWGTVDKATAYCQDMNFPLGEGCRCVSSENAYEIWG